MVKQNLLFSVLIAGIVLVGFGLYGQLSGAAVPTQPIGDPGQELALDNYISWRLAPKDGTPGDPELYVKYIGGYLVSFRSCNRYTVVEDGGNKWSYCNQTAGPGVGDPWKGQWASGFGILGLEIGSSVPHVLIPLIASDFADNFPGTMKFYDDLVWTDWRLQEVNQGGVAQGGNFTYNWVGAVGGCESDADPCGRVFLEHVINVKPRGVGGGVGGT